MRNAIQEAADRAKREKEEAKHGKSYRASVCYIINILYYRVIFCIFIKQKFYSYYTF